MCQMFPPEALLTQVPVGSFIPLGPILDVFNQYDNGISSIFGSFDVLITILLF